jgi:hypothetical protein
MTDQALTLINLKQRAQSGRMTDVDYLMKNLDTNKTFTGYKLIDFALTLVSTDEGRDRIEYFLFNGSQVQRNYAALYFNRRGEWKVLDMAVQRGCVDSLQAYSK